MNHRLMASILLQKNSRESILSTFGSFLVSFTLFSILFFPIFKEKDIEEVISPNVDDSFMITGDNPFNSTDNLGYEFLDDGSVFHMWNNYDSYFFNRSNGIQFSNHYEEYWSQNVLMLGYYNNGVWNLIYRTDELSGFTEVLDAVTDDYINVTLWKDLSYGVYDFRLALRYHLKPNDSDLTIVPYVKNLGIAIPYTLGFGWELKDIQIADTQENDMIRINGQSYLLNQTLDNNHRNMSDTYFDIVNVNDDGVPDDMLYLSWDKYKIVVNETDPANMSLWTYIPINYVVKVKSRTNQYNAPTTLFIRVGTLSNGQEKSINLHWYDADPTVTYYFMQYSASDWNSPDNMVDGEPGSYDSEATDGDTATLSENVGIYESNTDGGSESTRIEGSLWYAQNFTPSITHTIEGVVLSLKCSSAEDDLYISLKAVDGDGKPTGASLASGIVDVDSISNSFFNTHKCWFSSGYEVQANTQYVFVCSSPGAGSPAGIYWEYDTSGEYSGGSALRSSDSGSSWDYQGNDDMFFIDIGNFSSGTIKIVELRAYGHGDGNDRTDLTPSFDGSAGDEHQLTMPGSAGYTSYANITGDTNNPGWSSWTDIDNIDCNVEYDKSGAGNTIYCGRVEITVTYTVAGNNVPTQSGESPTNSSTDISVTPQLYVICSDSDGGDTLNATWYSNSSGAWIQFGSNTTSFSSGTNITQPNSNFSANSQTYWWSVNLSDGTDWNNETYHFTTIALAWNTVSSTINGSYSNTTAWKTISSTINGSYSNTTSFQTVDNTINGSYSNTTTWNAVTSTINGTYSNTTIWNTISSDINGSYGNVSTKTWNTVSNSINGSYSNTTSWNTVSSIVNGTYSNTTNWKTIDNSINGTYSNTTTWKTESSTINGTYSNLTAWNTVDSTINGTYSAIMTWTTVSSDINGTYSNTTSWRTESSTINGTYSNATSWKTISSTINGSYSNVSIISWNTVDNTINGTYSNLTTWTTVTSTINGTYSNITTWKTVISTINGSYSNTTTWNAVTSTINGTYSNTTIWNTISSDINGSYSNVSTKTWNTISSNINGSYSNTTTWQTITNTINGTYSNITNWNTIISTINGTYSNASTWKTISNNINGSYSNITNWKTISSVINGTYSNTTSWNTISSTINGSYSNTTVWNTVSSNINGTYSNSSTWKTVDTTINGTYSNVTSWNTISSTINGTYSSVMSWQTVISTINGSYSNTTTWTLIDNTVNGTYSNSSDWKSVDNTINGSYSNITSWNTLTSTINGSYSNTTSWKTIISTINGTYSSITTWQTVTSTINGSYSNTSLWKNVISTINGTYSNTTTWKTIDSTINGTYSNTTAWTTVSSVVNGTYSSIMTWTTVDSTINGTYSNISSWNTITNTINGTYSNTTQQPVMSNPSPANNSEDNDLALTWSITIYDNTGTFNYTINCSNGQNSSANNAVNGSKTLTLTGLEYDTQCTIWANATNGNGLWTNNTYYFNTTDDIICGEITYTIQGSIIRLYVTCAGSSNLTYNWEHSINDETSGSTGPTSEDYHYVTLPYGGELEITLTVTDGNKTQTLTKSIVDIPDKRDIITSEECIDSDTCRENNYYWYNNSCHEEPRPHPWNKPLQLPDAGEHLKGTELKIGTWTINTELIIFILICCFLIFVIFKKQKKKKGKK